MTLPPGRSRRSRGRARPWGPGPCPRTPAASSWPTSTIPAGTRSPSAASPARTARSSARPASAPARRSRPTSTAVRRPPTRTWDSCFTAGFAQVAGGQLPAAPQGPLPAVADPQVRDVVGPVRHAPAASAAAAASPGARSASTSARSFTRSPGAGGRAGRGATAAPRCRPAPARSPRTRWSSRPRRWSEVRPETADTATLRLATDDAAHPRREARPVRDGRRCPRSRSRRSRSRESSRTAWS